MSFQVAYQNYAAECLRIAETIDNQDHKASLRNMAQAWLFLAREDARSGQQKQSRQNNN